MAYGMGRGKWFSCLFFFWILFPPLVLVSLLLVVGVGVLVWFSCMLVCIRDRKRVTWYGCVVLCAQHLSPKKEVGMFGRLYE